VATDTRTRILDTAEALFEKDGLHRVGVREVARAVGMSSGNLAYHFRTKDRLVAAVVVRAHERNQAELFTYVPSDFSLVTLYQTALAAMRRTHRYLLLGYGDAVAASPELRQVETKLWENRRRRYDHMVSALVANGLIDRDAIAPHQSNVYEAGEMISSGWLRASRMGRGPADEEEAIAHYAKLGCWLLGPYVTARGRRQLREIMRGVFDPPATG
jgi:AcrR family transcriptional regulator